MKAREQRLTSEAEGPHRGPEAGEGSDFDKGERKVRRLARKSTAQMLVDSGERSIRSRVAALILCVLSACLLALTIASPALATDFAFKRIGQFGSSPGSGAGEFSHAQRLAVEAATGDVFVVDQDNDRVQVFSPQGATATFLTQFGPGTLDQPFGIAIREAAGQTHVYVSDAANHRIVEFDSDGADPPGFTLDGTFASPPAGAGPGQVGDFAAPLAIDPTSGDLLVADKSDNRIERYGSDGAFKGSFDGSTSPGGAFAGLADIGVEADGDILVADSTGPIYISGEEPNAPSRVERFDSAGAHLATIAPLGLSGNGLVAADLNLGEFVVGDIVPSIGATVFNQAERLATLDLNGVQFGTMTGLGIDAGPSGRLYAVAEDSPYAPAQHTVAVYEPVALPTLTIDPVDPATVSDSEATLSGSVDAEGASTAWHFEVRRGAGSWTSLPGGNAGAGTDPVAVQSQATGLEPNTSYEARLVASSPNGGRQSSPVAFETDTSAPEAVTRYVAPRTTTAARLNGLVNPRNSETEYLFEYGTSDSYGTSIPAAGGASAGHGNAQLLVSQEVSNLAPDTEYHYRIVANSSAGSAVGDDRTFRTRSLGEAGPPERGIELVNRPEKGNQDAEPMALSADGKQAIWSVAGGAPGTSTGSQGAFLAQRTANGWQSKSLLPPVEQLFGGGTLNFNFAAAAPDFTHFLFLATNGFFSENRKYIASVDLAGNQRIMTPSIPGSSPPSPIQFGNWSGATWDFSHVYVTTDVQVDPNHAQGTLQIYDFTATPPTLVTRMPSTGLPPACGTTRPSASNEPGFVQPADLQQVAFFHSRGDDCFGPWQLYVKRPDQPRAERVSPPAISGPEQNATLIRADRTGSTALFGTAAKLSAEDSNGTADVYRWSRGGGTECVTCVVPEADIRFVDSSYLAVANPDLSYLYFASNRQLVPGIGSAGTPALYVVHDGDIRYIGPSSLANEKEVFLAERGMTSRDGSVVLFADDRSGVTTDDNNGLFQLYRYDDSDRSVECLSCRHGRPSTTDVRKIEGGLLDRGARQLTLDGSAAVFQSEDRLLPEDIDGGTDIYEWRAGQLRLVTDGETVYPFGSGYLNLSWMSDDGGSIMFKAGALLTGYEVDRASQLYVARAGGGFPPPAVPPASCFEDSCQGPLSPPPPLVTAGSAALRGAGNRTAKVAKRKGKRCKAKRCKGKRCHKKTTRRKGKCAKGKKHARRAQHHRRAAR